MTEEEDAVIRFGEYLTEQYEVLRRVFSYLPTLDLVKCRQVCREWRKAAYSTVKERRSIQCLLYTADEKYPNFASDAELTLFYYTIQNTDSENSHAKKISCIFRDYYARYGIIALIDESKCYSRRLRVELPLTPKNSARPSVRFPPWNGVQVTTIENDCSRKLSNEDVANMIPPNLSIKAVLVISICHEEESDEQSTITEYNVEISVNCLRKIGKDFALAGIKLDCAEGFPDEDMAGSSRLQIILFSGPNVDAGSCVLDSYCRTQDAINAKITSFSKAVTHSRNSALLVFRCCGRDKVRRRYNYQPRENVETWENNSLIKLFPMTAAVGCYGIGEYGIDFPASPILIKRPRLGSKSDFNFEHGYSTIIMYISYKK